MTPAAVIGGGPATPVPHFDGTPVIVAMVTALAMYLSARVALRGQLRSTKAQDRANDISGMSKLAELLQAELDRTNEEHRRREGDLADRARTAEDEAEQLRAEVRRLRSDLAGVVLVINDEVARSALLDAYPDLAIRARPPKDAT